MGWGEGWNHTNTRNHKWSVDDVNETGRSVDVCMDNRSWEDEGLYERMMSPMSVPRLEYDGVR